MTQHPKDEKPLSNEDALKILNWAFGDLSRGPQGPYRGRPATPSMGAALEQLRHTHGWSSQELALRAGVPYQTMLRWKGDADLPDAESFYKLCDVLGQSPAKVFPMVQESARCILRDALALAGGEPQLLVARKRGPDRGDQDEAMVLNIPRMLRRGLAEEAGAAPDDVPALARLLRDYAARSADAQEIMVSGLAAELVLEGEEDA